MIQLTQNNFGQAVNVNVVDQNSTVVNLTGSTASIDLVFPDKTKINYPLTVTDAINGKLQLVITSAMTAKVGKLKGYIDIVNGSISKITLDKPLEFNVVADDGGVV